MSEFIASGRAADLILIIVLIEAIALGLLHRLTGRGVGVVQLLPGLVAGAKLVLALRCALTGAGAAWIALWLVGGLIAHLTDLRLRWQHRQPRRADNGLHVTGITGKEPIRPVPVGRSCSTTREGCSTAT
jgi:hypothetical protein